VRSENVKSHDIFLAREKPKITGGATEGGVPRLRQRWYGTVWSKYGRAG
jgi:hypothetical protein